MRLLAIYCHKTGVLFWSPVYVDESSLRTADPYPPFVEFSSLLLHSCQSVANRFTQLVACVVSKPIRHDKSAFPEGSKTRKLWIQESSNYFSTKRSNFYIFVNNIDIDKLWIYWIYNKHFKQLCLRISSK